MIAGKLARYSQDPQLTLSQLKKQKVPVDWVPGSESKYAEKYHICGTIQGERSYPKKLLHYSSAPYLLYYQGNLELLQQPLLGIVGPRGASEYAQQVMCKFFDDAKQFNLVTISGFAKGIDQMAHRLSLQHNIPTIAVLGGGFEHYLQGSDREFLAEIVAKGGLIISQYKLGFQPTKRSFPQRNKLLAQLCDILFLPEAQQKSGSLITSQFAHEFHKPVYSVPAPLFSTQSAGIFDLLTEQKIQLIADFQHCLQQHFYQKEYTQHSQIIEEINLSRLQKKILHYLQVQSSGSIEEFMEATGASYQELLQELTFLEMERKVIQSLPGQYQGV